MKNFNHRGHGEHGEKRLHEFGNLTGLRLVKKAHANSALKTNQSTVKAGLKLPLEWPQRKAAQRGIISREEIAGLLREARLRTKMGLTNDFSANLKPALRELAARSEKLTEFAMVRDANGQFVEVEDEGGMGMGTAVKAGAGAAALGGAGYGAYRADEAIMGKYGKQGLLNGLPSNYITDSVAKTGVATRGQAYRSAFKDIGNSVTSRARQGWAAGNAAYNAAGRRASAALPVEASGFGAKLLRGIRKGLSVATKMA